MTSRLDIRLTQPSHPVMDQATELRKTGQWGALAELLDGLPASFLDTALELRLFRAEAAMRLGEAHRAVGITTELLARADKLPASLQARSLLVRSAATRARGFADKALEDAAAAAAIVDAESAPVELQVEAHRQLGIVLGMTGDLDRSIEHFTQALRLCAKSADASALGGVHHALGIALLRIGRWAEARSHLANAIAIYRKLRNLTELAGAVENMGRLLFVLGEFSDSLKTYREALRLARQSKLRRTEAMTLVNIGDTLLELGSAQGALRHYRQALKAGEDALEPRVFACANSGLGAAYMCLGQLHKARLFLQQARYEAARLNLRYEGAVAQLYEGMLTCKEGAYATAEESLRAAISSLEETGVPDALVKAYLYLAHVQWKSKGHPDLHILQALARTISDFDLTGLLLHQARATPEVLQHAVSQGVGDGLFSSVLELLQAGQVAPPTQARAGPRHIAVAGLHPKVEVRTLGGFQVFVEGRQVSDAEWESQKAKELFIYLLLHPEGKSREELLEVLWPEVAVRMGRNAFYNNVYRVRGALYKESVLLGDGRYRVDPEGAIWLDLKEFRSLVAKAAHLPPRNAEEAEWLGKAVELYRGVFAPELYTEWSGSLRLETEAQYFSSVAGLAHFHTAKGNYEKAIVFLEKVLELDETDIEAYEQLLRLLIRKGDLDRARSRHRLYTRLMLELGVSQPLKDFAILRREATATR